tara:strand:- start:204284 stop:205645 length:1362 start_codon:yes stop_codon:yes gene_type:complete
MRSAFSLAQSATFSLVFVVGLVMVPSLFGEDVQPQWPQWRGERQNGFAGDDAFPKQWNESDDGQSTSGVRWKITLPGRGGSTPVVSGSLAFLTAGIGSDTDQQVFGDNTLMAIRVPDGEVAWTVKLGSDRSNKHKKGSGSNPSPVTDGKHVFAYFRSGDLACVDTEGNVVWHTNLQEEYGEDTLWWDLGTSPLLTENAVIVAVMQTGPSYLVAYDKKSGERLWKVDRNLDAPEEAAQSYQTPLNVTVDGRDAIAVMGADHLTIHDASDGRELGRLGGFNPTQHQYFRSIASPVAKGNIIVCPYARGDTTTAVHMDQLIAGKGKDAIAWFREGLGSDVPTPAEHEGRVYIVGDGKTARGVITCVDLETGKTIWETQLPKSRISFSSSPMVAGNHLYVTNEQAVTYVIGPLDASEPGVVATNKLSDEEPYTVSSLVPVEGGFLLRTRHSLYALGE